MRGQGLPQPSHRWALAASSLPLRARPGPPRPSSAGRLPRDRGGGEGCSVAGGGGAARAAASALRPGLLPRRKKRGREREEEKKKKRKKGLCFFF